MAWRLARSLETLQAELDRAYPHRTRPDWTIGDAAHRASSSDHNPTSSGVVCAIDVRGASMGWRLWDHLRSTRDERIKYLIFDGRIVSSTVSPWQVRPYSGSNPHRDHIHISVGRGPDGRSSRADLYDDTSPWGISGGSVMTQEDDMLGLRKGDTGDAVGLLQYMIKLAGEPYASLLGTWGPQGDGVDEHFGDDTETALLKLRTDYGSSTDQGEHVTYWAVGQINAMVADARAQRIIEQMRQEQEA